MKYRRFGRTEMQLSVFSYGCMRYLASEENAAACIKQALAYGINHLETARGYGRSEEMLGLVMPELPRDRVYITTKIGPTDTADQMRRYIDESLERMRCGWIDNFDIHGLNAWHLLEMVLKPEGCMAAVRRAQDEGLIRHVGFSTHAPLEVILAAMRTGEFESVNLHYYYFNQRNAPAIELARELDMGVFIISPTDKGGLLHKPSPKLVELSAPYTPIALNHRWLLQNESIHTLSLGAATPAEFAPHMAVADLDGPLTEQEAALLAGWDRQWTLLGDDYCAQCFDCLPCPPGVNIPEVLRLRNVAVAFDMVEYGRYRYNMMRPDNHWAPGAPATECNECGDCIPRCPVGLDIPALLFDTHERLTGEPSKRLWGGSE